MAKLKGDDEKPDGLEITSIGSLYTGPWDKKYWSSSRGKERYPYPVGYEAIRAHNGSIYKMEIHEGPKGPLFVISTADGHSSSGQTPDIAWEKFQKKYCPRMKVWHGRRFSCNIDGVEFFGFKNSFVQRLLRELVANISGSVEENLLSISFCKEDLKADHISSIGAHKHHDLLPNVEKSQISGKRSRRREIMNSRSSNNANVKRSRSHDLHNVAEASYTSEESQRIHGTRSMLSSFKGKYYGCEQPSDLPPSMNLFPVQEEKSYISENDFPLNSVDIPNNVSSIVPSEETRLVVDSKNCAITSLDGKVLTEQKSAKLFGIHYAVNCCRTRNILKLSQLDRLQATEVEDFTFSMALEVKEEKHTGLRDYRSTNDVELFAPDSLDLVQDSAADYGPSIQDNITNKSKEESTASAMIISEGLVGESHPEEEIGTFNSNGSSQKSDFDSVGQETAKSMMSFLLPQAIPLLKKASRKKKATVSPLEITPFEENNQKQNKETRVSSPAVLDPENKMVDTKEQMNIQSTNLASAVEENILPPDNSADQICGEHASYNEILPIFDANSVQVSSKDKTYPCNVHEESTGIWEHNESSDCFLETSESKDIFCYDEVHMDSSLMLQQDEVIPECLPSFTVSYKNNCVEEVTDACQSAAVGIDVKLQGVLSLSNTLPEESGVQNVVGEIGNACFTQVPSLVYSRRKKVKAISSMTGKHNSPLSESIICKKSGDNYVPETSPTKSSIALETMEMGSDKKSHRNDLSGVELKVLGQSQSLHVARTTVNSEGLLNNTVAAVSQDQLFMRASKNKETSYFLDCPGSHVQNPHIHVDKEVIDHKNFFVPNGFESSQIQGTSISNRSSSIAKEFQHSPDVRPGSMAINKGLIGMGELVGCYLHPLPVLSLVVSTIGEDIHICVMCGLLVNKDRTLFIYKVATQEPTVGHPSFAGHTSITLPALKDYFGKEIALERSGLHFTPGGKYLVLLDSIKTPYCRQGRIPCLCPACAPGSFEEDAVKIVEVKLGYVSVVAKLKTVESLQCLLVCEPNHLVTVGESGRLHLWVMNSAWSAQTEKFILPANDLVSPGIVELKKIPQCACLVVGHNGFGEFTLWDISKRILVSRFSAACTSYTEFFPVALFGWKKTGHSFSACNVLGLVNRMMAATNMWFSEQTDNDSFPPLDEDIAVWLLVSTPSDSDAHHDYISNGHQTKSVGWWRLALLVKNTVILGSALDPSAAAIGVSAGHGIIGTYDGLVYTWEMSTGTKLGTLHHFRGSPVSCIATDDSKKGAVAIAGGEGKLLVYLLSQNTKPK